MSYLIYPTTYKQVSTISLLNEYFPDKNCIPVVNTANFISDDNLAPDISILDNRYVIGVPIKDKLLIDDNVEKIFVTQNLFETKISEIINNFKNDGNKIVDCTYNHGPITFLPSKDTVVTASNDSDYSDFLFFENCLSSNQKSIFFEIDIPIIGVGGLIGFSNQSEIATKLSLELNRNKVNTKAIVSEKTHSLLNSLHIPDEIFKNRISFLDKCILLNHYIYFIITKYKCEALVVEIPGGLMKFSNQILNDVSQYIYLFIESMPISNFLLCAPINQYNYDFYKSVLSRIDSKFEWNTFGIHISNAHIDQISFKHNDPNYLLFRNMDSLYNYTSEIINSSNNDNIIIESLAIKNSFNLLTKTILNKL